MNSTLKVCIGLGCSFATNLSFAEQSTYVGASHFAFFEVPFLILAVVLSVYCAVTLKNLDISPSPKQLSRAMFAFSSGFLIMAVGHAVMLYRKFNEIDLFIEIFGPTLGGFIWIIALSLTWIFFAIGAYIVIRSITRSEIENETDQLQQLNKELVDKAYNDGLTQLLNRQCFEDNAASYWHDIQNNHAQSQFSVLMIDADYFKTINDKFGHSGGDFVLKTIADNLKRTVRNDDAIFRYGGEEFCVLLKETSHAAALMIAERTRDEIAKAIIHFEEHSISITISIGVAHCCDSHSSLNELVIEADKALYLAKDKGRNQVIVY